MSSFPFVQRVSSGCGKIRNLFLLGLPGVGQQLMERET